MFCHYHLRSASGNGLSGACTPSSHTPSLTGTHHHVAIPGSISSRGATLAPATQANPQHSDGNPFPATQPDSAFMLYSFDDTSLDEPISARVRHTRDIAFGDTEDNDPTHLSP